MNPRVSAHWKAVLGRGTQPGRVLAVDGDVTFLAFDDAELAAVHVATAGLADEPPAGAINRTELVCSVRPGQELAALFLLRNATRLARDGWVLTYDSMATSEAPVINGTQICGYAVSPLLWFSDADYIERADGMIDVQFVQILTLIRADIERWEQDGKDVFYERLNTTDADLLDLTRTLPI